MLQSQSELSHSPLESGKWPRGNNLELRGDYVYCRLDREHPYWLLEPGTQILDGRGFQRRAHLEFLRAESPVSLSEFVRNWGPLVMEGEDWNKGESLIAIKQYRRWQRYLDRLVRLFSSVRNGSDEPHALGEYLKDRSEMILFMLETARNGPRRASSDFLEWLAEFNRAVLRLSKKEDELGIQAGTSDEIVQLLIRAPRRHVRELMDLTIAKCANVTATLESRRKGRRGKIYPSLKADQLKDALECMVILDEWANHPLQRCDECGDLFRVDTRHERRFCSPECARRTSSRKFKKKQRLEQKKGKTKRSQATTIPPLIEEGTKA